MKLTAEKNAFVLLRVAMGINILVHGAVRLPKISKFRDWMVKFYADTPMPSTVTSVFATVLPFIEFTIGILLILGIFTQKTLNAGAILIIILLFGSAMKEKWEWVGLQMIYVLCYYFLIKNIHHNSCALYPQNKN